ncbi:hypothetical protein [Larsenimonas rhizosphaerae]|uniref:hypothetical protein n=1 Tax=Larsenimonas rhizosphaerae TaxID=2944682 RepID=UPI002033CADE|nr:hypothetical protein [Larsenimonas rhizosphaerae]MCM2131779.1 hypothetical protein [Larsenimonas rhizosphaerae]
MAADQSAAGVMTVANGRPMLTFGAKGLSSLLGISEAQAEFYYGLAGMGGELGAARQL